MDYLLYSNIVSIVLEYITKIIVFFFNLTYKLKVAKLIYLYK